VKPAFRSRLLAALISVSAIAIASGVAVAASTIPTGNTRTISFYKQSQAAMEAYEGIHFIGTGTSYMVIPKQGYDTFKFDFGATPAGYHTAVDHVRVFQTNDGEVTEEVDTMTAPGFPAVKLWQTSAIEIGEVATAHPCVELIPKNSASFVTLDEPFVLFGGYHFSKLTTPTAGLRLVRSTYALAGGTAHEKDLISSTSHLWQHSHLIVTGGPYNDSYLTESQFSYLHVAHIKSPPALGKCG
jgi:hypothetical protein